MQNSYDPLKKRYDQYRSFYSEESGFVSFETGEVMYVWSDPANYRRRHYPATQATIAFTSNLPTDFKLINPVTGKSIPDAQLKYTGGQHILIDHQSQKAVQLMDYRTSSKLPIPDRLRQASAYSLTSNSEVIGKHINVYAPLVMTEHHKSWLKTLKVTAKLMASKPPERNVLATPVVIKPEDTEKYSPSEFIAKVSNSASYIDNFGAYRIAGSHVSIGRQVAKHPYLNVEFR
jgi:hypothetical protein